MSNEKRIQMHEEIILKLHDTYITKNSDYGDSFIKVRNKIPNSILVRLMDKMNRLETLILSGKDILIKDESIEDTLLDLCGYAIMELIERKIDNENKIISIIEDTMKKNNIIDFQLRR